MKPISLYKLLIFACISVKFKNFAIADEATATGAAQTTGTKAQDPPPPKDTRVIEIKVNNESKNTDKSTSGIKVEEVKEKSEDDKNTKDATIATITVKVPNQDEQKIEIKNVENTESEPKKKEEKEKKTSEDKKEDDDKDTSFIKKIVKFIRSDFRFLVKFGAVFSSTLTQMIPLNLLLTIRKNKSTRNLKSLGLVTTAVSSMLWSLYGVLTKNVIIMVSSFPGALINLAGVWMFAKYCSDQSQKFILNISSKVSASLGVLLLILYFVLSSPTFLTVVGLFGGAILGISYLSPLVSFNEILESRNTSTMPTEISLGNFITSFFMFCYGFIIWDLLVIGPSFLGVISGLIQLTLLFLFPHSDRIIISEVEILEQPNNFKSMLTIDQEV